MTDPRRVFSRLAGLTLIGAGLSLGPALLSAQGVEGVEPDLLWSQDTGG